MSILCACGGGWFISHQKFVNDLYNNVFDGSEFKALEINENLFKVVAPFDSKFKRCKNKKSNLKRRSQDAQTENQFDNLIKEIKYVEEQYKILRVHCENVGIFVASDCTQEYNTEAVKTAEEVYNNSHVNDAVNFIGQNLQINLITKVGAHKYIFPNNCRFYCKNVLEIGQELNDYKFDLILLDPPWWNKYIRRKKAKTECGYQMMYSDDLKDLPLDRLLSDNGVIVVWCTNSPQHLHTLLNVVFPKWNVIYAGKWYWLKVTQSGAPICNFGIPPAKQPFEQIIFASRDPTQLALIIGKLVVSIPSALHSHKPPLIELLKPYLPVKPKCLELFARYLMPGWTSWGLEVIRFQHESLYGERSVNINLDK